MEKIRIERGEKLQLIGYASYSKSTNAVILAHGFTGDKSSGKRFDMMVDALSAQGYSVFAFDFLGCGESSDAVVSLHSEVSDLLAIIQYVKNSGYKHIALFGHSLGSLVCLQSFSDDIETLVLTGCLTGPIELDWKKIFATVNLSCDSVNNVFRLHARSDWRKDMVVNADLFKELRQMNQKDLLTRITKPMLLIHGGDVNDELESSLLEVSRAGMHFLPHGSRLAILKTANHGFFEEYPTVIQMTLDWLKEHSPCKPS